MKVENLQVPPNSLLLFLDVVSLYTSIPHEDIRSVVQRALGNDRNLQPPVHFILDLVDLLLEKNYRYFRFDNTFYFQTKGVSMGSLFAPSVANLFMAMLEMFILNSQQNPFFESFFFFVRFINDIFCL